jgi:hypothetical protein
MVLSHIFSFYTNAPPKWFKPKDLKKKYGTTMICLDVYTQ